jgi:hypothetical protein
MRAVIASVLHADDGATLDYTGGSKLMAAIARLELEPGGASRAVYLDPAGVVRWDDGRTEGHGPTLDLQADVAAARISDDPDWRTIMHVDRKLTKLQRSLERRLGDESETAAYIADARTELYYAGQSLARECHPRLTNYMRAALAGTRAQRT